MHCTADLASGAVTAAIFAMCAVLHAGMYYPPGTLKARACVDGRHMLEKYAKANGVPYSQLGKLIVAQNEQQRQYLEKLLKQAHANRVPECRMVSGEEAKELEPEVTAVAGLHCTVTGIIDSTALMAAFRKDAEEVCAQGCNAYMQWSLQQRQRAAVLACSCCIAC